MNQRLFASILSILIISQAGCNQKPSKTPASQPASTPAGQAASAPADKNPAQIIPEDVVQQWGYRTVKTEVETPTDELVKAYGRPVIYAQRIKAVKEAPNWPHGQIYYRFWIRREVYPSNAAAEQRGKMKNASQSETQKIISSLTKEFVWGNSVFSLSTGIPKFYEEDSLRLTKRLKQYVTKHYPK